MIRGQIADAASRISLGLAAAWRAGHRPAVHARSDALSEALGLDRPHPPAILGSELPISVCLGDEIHDRNRCPLGSGPGGLRAC